MNRVLIHSHGDYSLAEQMKAFLEARLPYDINLFRDRLETVTTIQQKPVHLIIYEAQRFGDDDLQFLKDLRAAGFSNPLMICAQDLNLTSGVFALERVRGIYLPKPFEYRALRGLTQKLVLARTVPQQMHRRYRTKQGAMVETFITGEKHPTEMCNLSMGGAYCEFADTKTRLVVGDLVRLRVNVDVDEQAKEHTVNGRVVWTTRKGMAHGGFGFGLRFIKGNDIYRQLIDKV